MDIMLGTSNPGKMKEFFSLLDEYAIELYAPADEDLGLDIKEVGDSYQENAALKAKAYAEASGMWALADDTGLEVDALKGAPGLRSARYASAPDATDADRREKLLQELEDHPTPWTARFRCVAALANPQGEVYTAEGTCAGQIIPEGRGIHGFGYDPIFLVLAKGRTMAELTLEEKNEVSHRARAIKKLVPQLERLLETKRL